MKILLIGNIKSYGIKRIKEEFNAMKINCDIVNHRDIIIETQNNKIKIKADNINILSYDIYLLRSIEDASDDLLIVLARHLRALGKLVIEEEFSNGHIPLDKVLLDITRRELPTIHQYLLFYNNKKLLKKLRYPLIIKSIYGSQGRGVFKVNSRKHFNKIIKKIKFPIIIQKFLPIKYDFRIFIVGNKILGSIKRYNNRRHFLTTKFKGKRELVTLPKKALDMALKAKKIHNIEIAGVDIIEHNSRYYVLEVNESPGFKIFERVSGINVAKEIVKYTLRKYKK